MEPFGRLAIIQGVRSFLLILLVALLPLRMWAAESMALQMAVAAPAMAVVHEGAVHDGAAQAGAMPADCPMMAGAIQGKHSGAPMDSMDAMDSQAGGGTCASCQLCGAVALPATFESAPAIGPRTLAPPIAFSFQSALPLLADKPPIS